MSNEELQRTIDALDKLSKDAQSSPERARQILVEAGIYTETGDLTAPYRQDA